MNKHYYDPHDSLNVVSTSGTDHQTSISYYQGEHEGKKLWCVVINESDVMPDGKLRKWGRAMILNEEKFNEFEKMIKDLKNTDA